jgi:hypothetical protein
MIQFSGACDKSGTGAGGAPGASQLLDRALGGKKHFLWFGVALPMYFHLWSMYN